MSDRFAYSAPPTAGGRKAEARKGRQPRGRGMQMPDRAESKQGEDDAELSNVSACIVLFSTLSPFQ